MEHRGFLLIADITGYTTYLNESELEHARQTLTDLLELVVEQTRPPLTVAQLEGDAVFSYAFAEGFVTAQTLLERIQETYVEFRRAKFPLHLSDPPPPTASQKARLISTVEDVCTQS